MKKYAKLITINSIQFPPKNKGSIINYDLNEELLIADGYKELIEAQKDVGKSYNITYTETATKIIENAVEIIPDPAELLKQAKEEKIQENDNLRDKALNQGVIYKDILFDSDTDQKVNLLATVSMMNDIDTVQWFGMNNDSLNCNKQDLLNIGGLITALHSFCWTKNAAIKDAINEAQTVDAVKAIVIDYTLVGENINDD